MPKQTAAVLSPAVSAYEAPLRSPQERVGTPAPGRGAGYAVPLTGSAADSAILAICDLRDALRGLVVAVEASWKAEGWSCAETSAQAPVHELEARNRARAVLGEPYEETGR